MDGGLNLNLLLNQLSRETWTRFACPPWLVESWRRPDPFWKQLKTTHDALLPVVAKSVPFRQYDFFHDIAVRNRASTCPALGWLDRRMGLQFLSYADLGDAATRTAAAWAAAGAAPGQSVAIALPFGPAYAVTLLAALKLGLVAAPLPPRGRVFVANRLTALAPDHVATEALFLDLIGDFAGLALPPAAITAPDDVALRQSYTYPPRTPALAAFDPTRSDGTTPAVVVADDLYLPPVRDALLALGIGPGQTVAAPGFHPLEAQPALLLACLLVGATYLHLSIEDVEEDPARLLAHPVDVMGMTRSVRELLLRTPFPAPPPWRAWFRDPVASADQDRWQEWVEACGLEDSFALNLRWKAAVGGCSLFSPRRRGWAHAEVLPAAGVPWKLGAVQNPESEAFGDFGLLSPKRLGVRDQSVHTTTLLGRALGAWTVMGTSIPSREGRVYPAGELQALLDENAPAMAFSVLTLPSTGSEGLSRTACLVFTGAAEADHTEVVTWLEKRIEDAMGEEHRPDRIRVYPLWPRKTEDGAVDHEWCREQYLLGNLDWKGGDEVFVTLSSLRKSLEA